MAELEAQKAKLTKKEVVKEEPKPPAKKKEEKFISQNVVFLKKEIGVLQLCF